MIRRWFILGILVIIMLILLWGFYRDAVRYNPIAEVEKVEKAGGAKEAKEVSSFKPAWGKEITEKNLFSPKRGYVPPEVIMAPKAVNAETAEAFEKPVLNLKGIIRNEQGEYIALIEKADAKAIPLRKGDRIDSALVVEIKERTVDLVWRNENIRLSMEKIKTLKR